MVKQNKILIFYIIVFYIITVVIITNILTDQSNSLFYIFYVFPIFWGISLFLLISIILYNKKNKKKYNKYLIVLSTPIPTILIAFLISINPYREVVESTHEIIDNKYLKKVVRIRYSDYKLKRIEYYISKDTISSNDLFPETNEWLKDSVWVYYNRSGEIEKMVRYNKGLFIPLDTTRRINKR